MQPGVVALLASTCAGLATTLGGVVVFFLDSYRVLPFAVCMAASAGVMTYVGLVEVFTNALDSFRKGFEERESDRPEEMAYLFTVVCFLAGWVLTTIFDKIVHCMLHRWATVQTVHFRDPNLEEQKNGTFVSIVAQPEGRSPHKIPAKKSHFCLEEIELGIEPLGVSVFDNDKRSFAKREFELHAFPHPKCQNDTTEERREVSCDGAPDNKENSSSGSEWKEGVTTRHSGKSIFQRLLLRSETTESDKAEIAFAEKRFKRQHESFSKLGFITALALALHNFPEGLATFAGTLANPSFGIGLAIAVGIHNIPEGFAVAVPIYYGTGSKWKGFWYSFLSGCAEPVGAVFGYFLISESSDPVVFGVLFSIVAGVICNIGLQELYPTAVRYDPIDQVVSISFFLAMAILAFSVAAFKFI